jgi:tetratricopeptide (TPR) repeat protein
MTTLSLWDRGSAEARPNADWRTRLNELSIKIKTVSGLRDYAEYLLRERWCAPELHRAMLVSSTALWLTENVGLVLIRSTMNLGERARTILSNVLAEWTVSDLVKESLVSYDTPLRATIESLLYERDRSLYRDCHALLEREVVEYLSEKKLRELADVSMAYHVSPLNPGAGMTRFCNLYERGLESHDSGLIRKVQRLSASQRVRHFGQAGFNRYFSFFDGFSLYMNGERTAGLSLLRDVVDLDGSNGPIDFPAQVAFHLVGNSLLKSIPRAADAIDLINRAVFIARARNDFDAAAQTLTTLGRAYIKAHLLDEAQGCLREAVTFAVQSERASLSAPLVELAEIYLRLSNKAGAREAAKQVLLLSGHPKTRSHEIKRATWVLEQAA